MAEIQSTVEYRYGKGKYLGYRLGDDGSVWSRRKKGRYGGLTDEWRKLVPRPNKFGRLRVHICPDGGENEEWQIHCLILTAFVGPCPEGMEVCHDDDDPSNNRLSNLRWGTRKSNINDRRKNGRHVEGEKHGLSKLTRQTVTRIREMHATENYSQTEIAEKFSITQQHVSAVVRKLVWAHLIPATDRETNDGR